MIEQTGKQNRVRYAQDIHIVLLHCTHVSLRRQTDERLLFYSRHIQSSVDFYRTLSLTVTVAAFNYMLTGFELH